MTSLSRICTLFDIRYPIIQAGMVWCSGWKLASAVSNCGGLGLIGSGSMTPDVLHHHIRQCKAHTDRPFGVNVPLINRGIERVMEIIVEEKVPIVFTSAGNPAIWTSRLKDHGLIVSHVVPNVSLAVKCEKNGVDAVVCEGFEAGGHNGKDEITSMCLIPQVVRSINVPVIAAGGIGSGHGMAAALALGAEGVQIGSRFAVTRESSAHPAFKQAAVEAHDNATVLTLKQVTPVRIIKNAFYNRVLEFERKCAGRRELIALLGKSRAKKGIFEGDLEQGELEIGQITGMFDNIPAVADLFDTLIEEFRESVNRLGQLQSGYFSSGNLSAET
ncbi:MAG: nitronate monooxygenase [Balneolales bacterium]